MSVRLAYFDAVTDIEAEYYELREKMTRDDTLAMLAEAHADELYDPDQNAFFWVAIGKAQSKYKEVTGDAAEKLRLGWSIWQNRFHSASTMRMLYARNSFPTHIGISPAQHGNGERQSFSIGKSGMYMHTK